MRKVKHTTLDTAIYDRLRQVRMSEAERLVAIDALRTAEQIAAAIFWIRNRFVALGSFFMKPSLKH
jgi:hypothetical protein